MDCHAADRAEVSGMITSVNLGAFDMTYDQTLSEGR